MNVLLIDGMNFMHRARVGFNEGPHALIFNFFRNLRSIVDVLKADKVCFVLEGRPKHRYDLQESYKANRQLDKNDKNYESKLAENTEFYADATEVIQLLEHLPITVIKHPDFECDDVIHCLAGEFLGQGHSVVVASSDTDFIQSVQEYSSTSRFSLYNPVKKEFVVAPQYDYVDWKCLRGDGTDNVPGIAGCGDKTARKLMTVDYPELLKKYLSEKPGRQERFDLNKSLIGFSKTPTVREYVAVDGTTDWDALKNVFTTYQFNSIINDKSWKKFVGTFEKD